MKYRAGDTLIVKSFFRFDYNDFNKNDIIRILFDINDFVDENDSGYAISNKSWISSQMGHSAKSISKYSFGGNTNWFVTSTVLESHCTLSEECAWE